MPAQARENGATRVSPMDQRGRPISPSVLVAAEELSRRAIHHAEKLLVDPAVAANLLEEAAATVSRALKARLPRTSGTKYRILLFRAFLRRLIEQRNGNRSRQRPSTSTHFFRACRRTPGGHWK